MRPRVFPAEDPSVEHRPAAETRRFNEAAGIPRGRLPSAVRLSHTGSTASMRPRVFPAEDQLLAYRDPFAGWASMRPRVFPAEDVTDGPEAELRAA